MSVYICESVNLNGGASDEASPFSFYHIPSQTKVHTLLFYYSSSFLIPFYPTEILALPLEILSLFSFSAEIILQ